MCEPVRGLKAKSVAAQRKRIVLCQTGGAVSRYTVRTFSGNDAASFGMPGHFLAVPVADQDGIPPRVCNIPKRAI